MRGWRARWLIKKCGSMLADWPSIRTRILFRRWVSMTVSVPSFILVTSLLQVRPDRACDDWRGQAVRYPTNHILSSTTPQSGLSYGEACLAVLIGSALVAPALVLNGRAGARYGISFPVLARASFGIRGSQLPTIRCVCVHKRGR